MSVKELNVAQVNEAFAFIADNMVASKERLTQADQAIGDGDHGIGMARGFEAVKVVLTEKPPTKVEEVFMTTGTTLLSSIGGASGAIFGSFFMGAAKGLKGCEALDAVSFKNAVVTGLEMVKKRGKAQIGDKTMVDALEPAADAAAQYKGDSLSELTEIVHTAAHAGMEKTKTFTAKIGKAKTLGDRTIGFADPGAISITLIFQFLNDFVS
jgi:dihydroxyacetone kinase-like protein